MKENLNTKHTERDREVKSSAKSDRRNWIEGLISEAKTAANTGHMKTVYMKLQECLVMRK